MFATRKIIGSVTSRGGVAEWFKALVLKTSIRSRESWVRIPPPPPGGGISH